MLNRQFSPDELRRWAAECGKEANNPKTSVSDRQRLFKMQSALIDLALTEEWLHPAVAEPVIVEFILPEEKKLGPVIIRNDRVTPCIGLP